MIPSVRSMLGPPRLSTARLYSNRSAAGVCCSSARALLMEMKNVHLSVIFQLVTTFFVVVDTITQAQEVLMYTAAHEVCIITIRVVLLLRGVYAYYELVLASTMHS